MTKSWLHYKERERDLPTCTFHVSYHVIPWAISELCPARRLSPFISPLEPEALQKKKKTFLYKVTHLPGFITEPQNRLIQCYFARFYLYLNTHIVGDLTIPLFLVLPSQNQVPFQKISHEDSVGLVLILLFQVESNTDVLDTGITVRRLSTRKL